MILVFRDFVKLVLVANLCAWPVAWLVMHNWIQKFPYHVNLSWSPFALAGLLALIATLAAVAFQTLRASLTDPVHSLRHE